MKSKDIIIPKRDRPLKYRHLTSKDEIIFVNWGRNRKVYRPIGGGSYYWTGIKYDDGSLHFSSYRKRKEIMSRYIQCYKDNRIN